MIQFAEHPPRSSNSIINSPERERCTNYVEQLESRSVTNRRGGGALGTSRKDAGRDSLTRASIESRRRCWFIGGRGVYKITCDFLSRLKTARRGGVTTAVSPMKLSSSRCPFFLIFFHFEKRRGASSTGAERFTRLLTGENDRVIAVIAVPCVPRRM